jgi:hypothetical protein
MEDISGRFILSRLGKKRDQSLKVNIVSLIQSLHFIYVLCIILNNRNKEYNTNFYHLISNNKKLNVIIYQTVPLTANATLCNYILHT